MWPGADAQRRNARCGAKFNVRCGAKLSLRGVGLFVAAPALNACAKGRSMRGGTEEDEAQDCAEEECGQTAGECWKGKASELLLTNKLTL